MDGTLSGDVTNETLILAGTDVLALGVHPESINTHTTAKTKASNIF